MNVWHPIVYNPAHLIGWKGPDRVDAILGPGKIILHAAEHHGGVFMYPSLSVCIPLSISLDSLRCSKYLSMIGTGEIYHQPCAVIRFINLTLKMFTQLHPQ